MDTNVFVSYLLSSPDRPSPVRDLVAAMIRNQFLLIMPPEVLTELERVLSSRPYLVKMIDRSVSRQFIEVLEAQSEKIPLLTTVAPSVVRDPRDDFLIEQAKLGNVDYLVSGDRDLLALAESINKPRIVSPAVFLTLLG